MPNPSKSFRPPTLPKPIVLVGLMGAGKSTVGRRLANKLDLPFADADVIIEERMGCSISTIFDLNGEAYFRDVEKRILGDLLGGGVRVIATGGGAFTHPPTRQMIKEEGISVWLRADLDVLVERVSRRQNHRPLLEKGDKRTILEGLMNERYPLYAEADFNIDSNESSHEKVVTIILNALNQAFAES